MADVRVGTPNPATGAAAGSGLGQGKGTMLAPAKAFAAGLGGMVGAGAVYAPPAGPDCSTCTAYWPIDAIHGYCKAHPPQPLFGAHFNQPGSGVPKIEHFYPEVTAAEWCREYIKK